MRIHTLWLALAALTVAHGYATAQATGPDFSITIGAPRTVLESSHQIRLNVITTMVRAAPFEQCVDAAAAEVYSVRGWGPDGKEPPESPYLEAVRGTQHFTGVAIVSVGNPVLVPGEAPVGATFTAHLDLAALYDLSRPGRYEFQVSRPDLKGIVAVSNKLSIIVVPKRSTSPGLSPSASGPFTISIWPGAVDPFDLQVATKNVSDHPIDLATAEDYQRLLGPVYRVDLATGDGSAVPETELSRSVGNRNAGPPNATPSATQAFGGHIHVLKPGQEWYDPIHVAYLYQIGQAGDYTVQVRRWDDESKTWVKSNAITVTVTP
jgi:hypothetical protein